MTNTDNDARPVPRRVRSAPPQPDPMAPAGPAVSTPEPGQQQQQPPRSAPAPVAPATPPKQEVGEVNVFMRVSPQVKSDFRELHTALGLNGKELFELMVKEATARFARTGRI